MEERIRVNRHDVDAWRVLLAEAGSQSPAEFRPVFEAAVTAMPLCAPVWMRWVEAELRACQADQVEAIFELCLLRCPQLPLWQLFLNFVKGVKVVGLDAAAVRAQLLPALELLLEAIGAAPAAGPLWQVRLGHCPRGRGGGAPERAAVHTACAPHATPACRMQLPLHAAPANPLARFCGRKHPPT
jgi:cleavage stimulation factor subunit 3